MNKSLLIGTISPLNQCYVSHVFNIINLDRLLEKHNIKNEYIFRSDINISLARNLIINYFIKSSHTHLLFIDYDIDINENYIFKLIELNKDFISLIYPENNINWENIVSYSNLASLSSINEQTIKEYGRNLNITTEKNINDELVEIKEIECGIVLIKKEVFINMIDNYPNNYFYLNGEKIYNFFESIKNQEEYLTDDKYFCKKWRDIGGIIYTIKNIICNRYGYKKYE